METCAEGGCLAWLTKKLSLVPLSTSSGEHGVRLLTPCSCLLLLLPPSFFSALTNSSFMITCLAAFSCQRRLQAAGRPLRVPAAELAAHAGAA